MKPAHLTAILLVGLTGAATAETMTLSPVAVTEWKAVYGRIEARERVAARARIGGTLVSLAVTEGDVVHKGQFVARVVDEKLRFQLSALTSQREASTAQRENAQRELARGEALLKQGVTTVQRLDALRAQVGVIDGQIAALDAQADIIRQSQAEGDVLAPTDGRALQVPVSQGGLVLPGETIAVLSGGGTFLRLAVPERHAASLHEGDGIQIEGAGSVAEGRLAHVYPLIENGRVVADVKVSGLSDRFVDARVLVRLPVGKHDALMVPASAIVTRGGLDFVSLDDGDNPVMRVVVPGVRQMIGDAPMVEILTGLVVGDRVIVDPPSAEGPAND